MDCAHLAADKVAGCYLDLTINFLCLEKERT